MTTEASKALPPALPLDWQDTRRAGKPSRMRGGFTACQSSCGSLLEAGGSSTTPGARAPQRKWAIAREQRRKGVLLMVMEIERGKEAATAHETSGHATPPTTP
jgi:hypothetical protein